MEEKKCCTVINNQYYGCCGCKGNSDTGTSTPAPFGALKYMQLEADVQSGVVADKKIYFNNKSFGDFELTANGTVVLNPGTYQVSLNCQINHTTKAAYLSLLFYDVISKKEVGYACSRMTATFIGHASCSEGNAILRFTEKVELCINCNNAQGDPNIEDLYASIIQIAELPATEV